MIFLVLAAIPAAVPGLFIARALLDAQARNLITSSFKSKHTLPEPPTRLSFLSIITVFSLVILKYLLHLLPRPLHFSPPLRCDEATLTFQLPYAEISAPIFVSDQDLIAYKSAIKQDGHPKASVLSPSGTREELNPLFLLAPLSNPLLLLLVSKQTNPILPLGAVNVCNRFEFHNPEACSNLLKAQAEGVRLTAHAHLGGPQSPGRRVRAGMEFDVSIFVVQHDPRSSSEKDQAIFSYTFTVLQRLPGRPTNYLESKSAKGQGNESIEYSSLPGPELKLRPSDPLRWAKLCKDYNPIHISAAAARLFGFKGKIAHGNLVVGMVLASVRSADESASSVPTQLSHLLTSKAPVWLEVSFRRPMTLRSNTTKNKFNVEWRVASPAAAADRLESRRNGDDGRRESDPACGFYVSQEKTMLEAYMGLI